VGRIGYPDEYGGQAPAVGTRRPRGWYPEPRDRNTDRGRPPEPDNPSYTNRATVLQPVYPPDRLRVELQPEFDNVYDRAEPFFTQAVAQSNSITYTFSGVPDFIDVLVTQEGFVRFFDQNGIQIGGTMMIPANTIYESGLQARSVVVGNFAATAQDQSVVGKWRKPYPVEPRQADLGAPR
jgi:hypothetical protein